MPENSADRKVVIAGASGLIGRALVASFEADGVSVTKLVRREPTDQHEVRWQDGTPLDPEVLRGADAVFCLNGTSIGSFPWTRKKRQALFTSRQRPREDIARALTALGVEAPHFVHASAVGIYGCDPAGIVSEDTERGSGFIADLAAATERAASLTDTPVAHARFGIVLHPDGVLRPLIPLTLLGLSGRLGSGTQSWPWVALDDAVRALRFIADQAITGQVNVVGPTRAVMNDVGFAVARELNKPYLVPVPAWALRTLLGSDAADNLLLVDAHVTPAVLQREGFTFNFNSAEGAIHDALTPLRLDA